MMLKIIKYIFSILVIVVFLSFIALVSSGNTYVLKALASTYLKGRAGVGIEDYKLFENRLVEAGEHQPWDLDESYNQRELTSKLLDAHEQFQSIAWLVIKKGKIVQEHYWGMGHETSVSNSFSMAKTMVSLCFFKAVEEGYIDSLNQAVNDYFEGFDPRLTLADLSRMSSGLNWDESYSSPFSITTEAYFGTKLKELILQLEVIDIPGQSYEYLSGNTTLLSLIIEKATGLSLSEYCAEKFWKPMGSKQNALWMLDRAGGIEKSYCCFNSNARDFARWGLLTLHQGDWKGETLLDSSYFEMATRPYFDQTPYYGYGYWLDRCSNGAKAITMRGILGQYIIAIPEEDLIIVRLGHQRGPKTDNRNFPDDYYVWLEEALKMFGNK